MAVTTDIKDWFKSSNKNWGSRIGATLMIAVIGTGIYFVYPVVKPSKKEVVKEDCGLCISQLKEVNETIKLILSDGKTIPAAYSDTLKKPLTVRDKIEMLKRLQLKLDSILKQDSINKQKTKT